MKQLLRRIYSLVFTQNKFNRGSKNEFVHVENSVLKRRNYDSYEEYLEHQGKKLALKFDGIKKYDLGYEKLLVERYQSIFNFKNTTMLCLAARLGGEVRAFKTMGSVAIGIDIEPGSKNEHVMYGDFHSIAFPDNSFDFLFTNALDHAFDLDQFFKECFRVIKNEGKFILELGWQNPGQFESIDTSNHQEVFKFAQNYFNVSKIGEMKYSIDFVDWSGIIYVLEKNKS